MFVIIMPPYNLQKSIHAFFGGGVKNVQVVERTHQDPIWDLVSTFSMHQSGTYDPEGGGM